MPKKFDCEEEPNEFMEAPCRCDCGMWFDLEDGHNSKKGNKIICRECHEAEQLIYRGDDVVFKEDCVINGRTMAYENEKGVVVSNQIDGRVSIKLIRRKYPIHYVHVSILEKY